MACFMACHACYARTQPLLLLLLSRAILQPNPTPIALCSGIISSFDSLSPHLIRGHNKLGKRQAADHIVGWDQGVCIAA